jgi:hypothetical protein
MDIFAHSLWGAILGKAVHRFSPKGGMIKISPWWTGAWAIFPDLLAFVPLALVIATGFIFGDIEEVRHIISSLYSLGHSLVTWLVIFLLTWIIFRAPRLELLGWLSHIVIDIFTHPIGHYPTPFLWPISNVVFDGTRWAVPGFMVINYLLILSALYFLRDHKNIREGFHAISTPRKIFIGLLFLSSLTAFIR